MIRLLLLFFIVFIISFISFILINGLTSLGMLWIAKEMGFFHTASASGTSITGPLFKSMIIPGIMFSSIVTGMCCIIVYKALQKKQHLKIGNFVTIFKSFLFFTALFCIGFFIMLMMMSSGQMGLLLILSFINVIALVSKYGLTVIWLILAWYWVVKYESKFINDEEEWMLR
jgi:hypothetical protein